MNVEIDPVLLGGLRWMKHNWEKNGWCDPSHHFSLIWPAICNLSSGQVLEDELNTLIAWTHPRSEIYAGMEVPPDVDNTGGWGAARKISEIHNLLTELKYRHSFA